jgi:hypothetical protein
MSIDETVSASRLGYAKGLTWLKKITSPFEFDSCIVESNGNYNIYKWDDYSSEEDDGANVIASSKKSDGRWVVKQSIGQSFNATSISELSEISAFNGASLIVQDRDRGGIFKAVNGGTVDDGVVFASATVGWTWQRVYDGDFVHASWFGAVLDGVTDDSTIIQSILDDFRNVIIDGNAAISTKLEIKIRGSVLMGLNGRGTASTPTFTAKTGFSDDAMLQVSGPQSTIKNCVFLGLGATVSGSHCIIAEEDFDGENNGDVDLYINNCVLGSCRTLVKIIGRGLKIEDSNLVFFTHAIEIDWPTDFVEGGNPDQKTETGMRVYKFSNNRFHGASGGWIIQNSGLNAANINGIQFTNNYIDTNVKCFTGHFNYSIWSSNTHIHLSETSSSLFNVASCESSQVANNVFYGMLDNGDGGSREFLRLCTLDSCNNFTLANNIINRCTSDVVVISSSCTNLNISGNIFKNVMLDNFDGGGTRRFILKFEANVEGLIFKNNIIDVPSMANNNLLLSDATGSIAVTNNSILGNVFDSSEFKISNFNNTSIRGYAPSDKYVVKYDGDGSDPKTFSLPFKPLVVFVSCIGGTNVGKNIAVSNYSTAGNTLVEIDGYDILVKSDYNQSSSIYTILAIP